MGCDIHMFCEERKTMNDQTFWINADHWKPNPYHCAYDDGEDPELDIVGLLDDRDYSMFTALCGMRDYTEKSPKISDPKGLPNDVTDAVKKESDRWDCDGHSHSYATLREVKEFVEAGAPIKFSGLITPEAAKALDEDGTLPLFWCQGSSSPMEFREWEDTTQQPLKELLDKMTTRFNPYGSPLDDAKLDDFRIVFWFDN